MKPLLSAKQGISKAKSEQSKQANKQTNKQTNKQILSQNPIFKISR
jgi:hypothetical protein